MPPTVQKAYLFEEFRFDTETNVLYRGDGRVEMTPKAGEILNALLENAGAIVSKEELMRRAWPDSFVEEANLSHHIFNLRKAIGEKLIETVPKRGYRFAGRLTETPVSTSDRAARLRWLVPVAVIAMLIAVIGGAVLISSRSGNIPPATDAAERHTIAVMPFLNESGDAELEYLADGMTEILINNLSQIPDLRVKPRNAVFRLKERNIAPESVGEELKVRFVLFGRFAGRGDDLTLFLSLIESSSGFQMWGKRYSTKITRLADLQDEMIVDVSRSLPAILNTLPQPAREKRTTVNNQAYILYLKGRQQINRKSEDGFRKAQRLFDDAIAADPTYALAHAGLADTYNQMGLWLLLPPSSAFPKAQAAAEKAIALEQGLAEAHCALAIAKFYSWEFAAAEREFENAIRLAPDYALAREYHAVQIYETDPRRRDEAFRELAAAREIDPLSLSAQFWQAALYYFDGRQDEALAEMLDLQNTDPNYRLGYGLLGAIYREKGMEREFVDAWLKASSLEGGDLNSAEVERLKDVFNDGGVRKYSVAYADLYEQRSKVGYVSPIFPAMHCAVANERDEAFRWLEKAFAERSSWLVELRVDPVWKNLREDARYADLLRRIGFPD